MDISAEELEDQLVDRWQSSGQFLTQPIRDNRSRLVVERRMIEQRTRSEAIDVSPNMRGICRGSSEVGGGVDVGILFEENVTVARFYWLPTFNLRRQRLESPLKIRIQMRNNFPKVSRIIS